MPLEDQLKLVQQKTIELIEAVEKKSRVCPPYDLSLSFLSFFSILYSFVVYLFGWFVGWFVGWLV
jgi:hypothetical protein